MSREQADCEESYIFSKEFKEDIAKVGEGSSWKYRSFFDPAPSCVVKGDEGDGK
ncbi:MAG: hypothetical protein GX224_02330 [Thermoplasmatales archaeon]|nr:hypothetical protein [Thermoplasmatales archaeon]